MASFGFFATIDLKLPSLLRSEALPPFSSLAPSVLACCSSDRLRSWTSGWVSFEDLVALASGWPSLAAWVADFGSNGMTTST